MEKNFYIADPHFGHGNIIKLEDRPFASKAEMEQKMTENWNNAVSSEDTVYILGDFGWGTEDEWIRILKNLNGKKVLIRGNHDPIRFENDELYSQFQSVRDYIKIKDNGRNVILFHYPIPFYHKDYDANTYMLYGHVHKTLEETMMQEIKKYILQNDTRGNSSNKCNFFNCWCGFYDYTPVTLDQILERWQ